MGVISVIRGIRGLYLIALVTMKFHKNLLIFTYKVGTFIFFYIVIMFTYFTFKFNNLSKYFSINFCYFHHIINYDYII